MQTRLLQPGTERHGIVFVSLGAAIMTPEFLNTVTSRAEGECDLINWFLLDVPEMINVRNLEGVSEEDLWPAVTAKADAFIAAVSVQHSIQIVVSRWSDYALDSRFDRYKEAVLKTYMKEPRFQRHCHNQTFRNLQPVLKRIGILRKNEPLVRALSEYLCLEIAMKLFIAESELACVEFAPEGEMQILSSIYDGEYTSLLPFLNRRMRFVIVKPDKKPLPKA
jgi:hypothetical protein